RRQGERIRKCAPSGAGLASWSRRQGERIRKCAPSGAGLASCGRRQGERIRKCSPSGARLMAVARRPFLNKVAKHLLLLPFLAFALFPFYHMTLTSLKQDRELYDRHAVPLIITQGPTLEHYSKLLWDTEFLTWTKNSLLVTVLATVVSVFIGTIAAYALARLKFAGVAALGTGIFVTYLVPTSLLFLPLAQVITWLGLGDSKWALVLTYPTFLVPFCTWLLIGYLRTVPKEIEECAMVDGATRIQALWRIILPTAVPGLVCA